MNEDHLFRDGRRLLAYAQRVVRRWPPEWGDAADSRVALERELGDALARFLASRTDKPRVVSKTPHLDGIDVLLELLPAARVIALIRDGRSVVASIVRGFGSQHDRAIRVWRDGARALLRVQRERGHDSVLVVRYEALLQDFEAEVGRVLAFCELDPDRFDMERARTLPVTGSSFDRPDHGKLTWEPVDRRPEFGAHERHTGLGAAALARFDWLAGREQAALGYPPSGVSGRRLPWLVSNLALDAVWPVRAVIREGVDRALARALRARRARAGDVS